jgi:hypothetical protein
MKLSGAISSSVKNASGHSQVRLAVPGFGEVIFSAPKEALAELLAIPDDAQITLTIDVGAVA